MEEIAERETQKHDGGDADGRVEEARASSLKDLMQVHPKTESDDGGLQEKFGQALAFDVKGMHGSESVDEATEERKGRRDESGRGEDQCQEKYVLAHRSSLRWRQERSPSSSFDGRLAELIGWIWWSEGVFGQCWRGGGHAREQKFEMLQQDLVAPDQCVK